MSTDTPDDDVLIDPTQTTRDQSVQAFWVGDHKFPKVILYRYPLDTSSPESLQNVIDELGPHAKMPDDPNGVFYFGYITDRAGNTAPVLIPEGEVRSFILGIACAIDVIEAKETFAYYPYLLP